MLHLTVSKFNKHWGALIRGNTVFKISYKLSNLKNYQSQIHGTTIVTTFSDMNLLINKPVIKFDQNW